MQIVKELLPSISVIVPCRNERDYIESCLRSILAQVPPVGGFEIIVADGMSDDGTRDIIKTMAEEDPRIRMIDNPGRIVSSGLNLAVGTARGQIIVRADAHTEYAPDYIRQCQALLRQTGADNIGGPWVAKGRGYVSQAIAGAFQSSFAIGGARGHDPNYEGFIDTVYLCCWAREVFDRVGLFDEELVRNQDDEFNLRLTRAGGKIWQSPRIRSWYTPRGTLKALLRQYRQYGYWKVRVIQKHKMPASIRHLVPGGFVFLLILLPLLSLWWPLAAWIWIGLIVIYCACNIAASLATAKRRGWKYLPLLPLVFGCFHFGYGYGFLHGLLDFVILHRSQHRSYGNPSRNSSKESIEGSTSGYKASVFLAKSGKKDD
jgi:succinoglycan biosynthesis protein ExoA